MSKARSKPSPTKTYDSCRLGILDGLTQKQIITKLKISKPTLSSHLEKKGTSWKELIGKTKSKAGTLPNNNKLKDGGGANEAMKPPDIIPHSQTSDDSRQGDKPGTPSKYINDILSIQSTFCNKDLQCTVKDAILLRDNQMQFEGMKDIPNWEVPPKIQDNRGKSLYHPQTYERVCFCTDWIDKNGKSIVHLVRLKNKETYMPDKTADFNSAQLPPTIMERVYKTHALNKQMLILKAICNRRIEIVAVEADKRKGKSTIGFAGCCQGAWEGLFKKIGLWASGEDNAIGILGDMFNDEISVRQTFPLFKGQGSEHQKVFFNNAIIKAFSNNAARTSGLDFDLCWIDEAHEVVVEHKHVFDMIIMTMRAKPTIKLLVTMNKGTGTYHNFKRSLEEDFGKEVTFFVIEDGDITHFTETADRKVRALVRAVGGKKEEDRWLNNKAVSSSTFDAMSVIYAYENYELFLTTHQPKPYYTVASYDPSGTGHPMGYTIWSCDITGTFFWQRFGIEYELGERPEEWGNGEKLNHRQIQADMLERAHEFKITHFISESNMDGKATMIEFRMRGFNSENQNYGNDKNKDGTPSRGAMCHIVRQVMDNQALFINSERLRDQWSIYNPDEHEKSNKYKGDEADSGIQAIYYLCLLTNSPYLSQENYQMEWI